MGSIVVPASVELLVTENKLTHFFPDLVKGVLLMERTFTAQLVGSVSQGNSSFNLDQAPLLSCVDIIWLIAFL